MVSNRCTGKLIVETNVRAFFQSQIAKAVNNQGLKARDDTVNYVVNLLMAFINAKALFDHRSIRGLLIQRFGVYKRHEQVNDVVNSIVARL